jgi:hypothetical protein
VCFHHAPFAFETWVEIGLCAATLGLWLAGLPSSSSTARPVRPSARTSLCPSGTPERAISAPCSMHTHRGRSSLTQQPHTREKTNNRPAALRSRHLSQPPSRASQVLFPAAEPADRVCLREQRMPFTSTLVNCQRKASRLHASVSTHGSVCSFASDLTLQSHPTHRWKLFGLVS